MAKHRVQLFNQSRGVEVDTDATPGATVGVNLTLEDGTVVTYDMLFRQPPADSGDPGAVYWRTIMERPPNVDALGDQTGAGIFVLTAPGSSAVRQVTSDSLVVDNPAGLSGDIRVEDVLRLPAGEAIHGRRVVFVEGGEAFHPSLLAESHATACVGISLNAASASEAVNVRQRGRIEDSGWSWTPGPIFCDEGGILTQTPPASGWSLIVGRSVSPTVVDVGLQLPIIRSN